MPELFLDAQPEGKVLVLALRAEQISQREAEIIEASFFERDDLSAFHRIAVDMGDVTFLASAGIGTLVRLHKHCQKDKGKLSIFGLQSEIEQILKLSKLDKLFRIKPDRASAIKAVS